MAGSLQSASMGRLGTLIDRALSVLALAEEALADRFGLVLGFYSFNQDTYLQIVDHYARKAGLSLPADELRAQALRWAVRRASRSGRTGKQFVDDLAGRTALEGD